MSARAIGRLLLAALCLAPAPLDAQAAPERVRMASSHAEQAAPDPIRFRHLTIADGLSQNAVMAFAQDDRGFMWLGTKDGLNRYDGYEFLVFRHDPTDSSSLSDGSIGTLFVDSGGRLWVGTVRGGLNRFDRDRDSFRHYPEGPTKRISSIQEGRGGDLWVATLGGGLYRIRAEQLDAARPRFEHFIHDPADRASLSGDTVTALVADRRGVLWVATDSGLDRLDAAGASAPAFHHYRAAGRERDGLETPRVAGLFEDASSRLWVGGDSWISVLDSARSGFTRYRPPRGVDWGHVASFAEDPQGRIWISSSAATMRLDARTGTFTYLRHDPLDPESINAAPQTMVFADRSGVMWLGSNGYGVDVHDSKAERFHTFRGSIARPYRFSGFSVHSLFEDSHSDVWIFADGLYRWNRESGALVSLEASTGSHALGASGVWAAAEAPRGVLWFGTSDGLYRYVLATGAVRRYGYDPSRVGGLPEPQVRDVLVARDGSVWVATENFLAQLSDSTTGRFRSWRYTEHPIHGTWPIHTLHEAAGAFWLGTVDGLVRVDPATGTIRHYRHEPNDSTSLGDDMVRSILPDPRSPDEILWVGTAQDGLNRLDIAKGTFTRFTVADGLPNNTVVGVLADEAGDLWLSTNRGICRLDPRTKRVRTYDARDGLQSDEFNLGAYVASASGELFFGGLYGFTYFRPKEIRDNPHAPPVVITGLRLDDRVASVRDTGTILSRPIAETRRLRLSYRTEILSLTFAALDYSEPAQNRYAYRLLGLNDRWVDAGAERTATYTNLSPGSYTFEVRASNDDGVWSTGGASLALTIVPPWWRTPWAYALYAICAVGALYGIRRYEVERLRLRSGLEMQRVEAEHLREMDRARSRFFANVSHEFRTPLTLTMGPLDDLRAGRHGPLSPEISEQVDLARRSAGRVLDLIDQLLEVARLEARQTKLRAVRLDLGAAVRSVARSFAPMAERKVLSLEVHGPVEPVEVYADPGQLERIIANLLSNAVKFTPSGGRVRVVVDSDAESARVAVRDSGPGIPTADMPRVFDRFYRSDHAATRNRPGTGIGLALAKELAELHGGSLGVTSEEGFGSTFTLTLRRGRTHLAPDEIVGDEGREGHGGPHMLAGAHAALEVATSPRAERARPEEDEDAEDRTTVLVVEDNAEVRAYLREHLSAAYRVLEAHDGSDGLERARRLLPDLVLSDVMMDGLDGYALCRALKRDPETEFIPVILVTARAAPEDRLAGLHEQADDYVTKPFDSTELLARVENLIASRKRLRERFAARGFALHPSAVDVEPSDAQFLERVQAAVEAHIGDETFGVQQLAHAVAHSRGHLHRRLRELAGESPSDLIRRMRLERAAQLLDADADSVGAIAYAVGFKSVAHFSNRFQDRYGVRPSAYRTSPHPGQSRR